MKEKKKRNVPKLIFGIFSGAVIVLFLVMFIMTKASGSPMFIFGRTTMWVMTESMSPTIEPKTYILVRQATADDVEIDDIVVFVSEDPAIYGQLNTHRVVAKNGSDFVTKGDHNPSDDGAYSAKAENVVGIYERTLPVMTFFGRIVLAPVGFAIVMILFVAVTVICVLPDVKSAVKSVNEEAEEKKKREMERLVLEEVKRLENAERSAGTDNGGGDENALSK